MSNAPWLDYLIKLENEGFKEIPGEASNQKILDWAHGPGQYPAMDDDSTTPWCGIGLAGVFSDIGMANVIPKGPASAINWLNCGVPCELQVGAIAVFPRTGGNHVTVVREIRGNEILCTGCNQSNAVTTARYYADEARGFRWPTGAVTRKADVPVVKNEYSDLLQRMQVRPEWQSRIDSAANKIVDNRARYKEVEEMTGVPWAFIGVLHMRESTNNFNTHLHNGDSLKDRTHHVPAGRPAEGEPPFTWEESAVDALDYEGFIDKGNWTLENICDRGERYNGLGYKKMGLPSPYLWSGTTNYVRGKYVADGEFDASAVDKQCGIIPVYLRTLELARERGFREGSRKFKIFDWVVKGIQGLIATVSALFTADGLGVFKDYFTTVSGVFDVKTLITVALTGAAAWIIIRWIDSLMMQDARAGAYVPSAQQNTKAIPLYSEDDQNNPDDPPVVLEPEKDDSILAGPTE